MIYSWTLTADVSAGALQEWLRTAEGRPVGPIPGVTDGRHATCTVPGVPDMPAAWLVRLAEEMRGAGLDVIVALD